MIKINRLQKSYSNHLVLDIANLIIPPGIYWIKGSNGAGKSTLFKTLAGIIPFKGEITIQDISITQQPVLYRSLISHSPAEPVFPSFLKGQELVNFYLQIRKTNAKLIGEISEMLSIDHWLQNPCGTYSSGMLKKLSLLLSFIGNTQWIFLDEPFTTLDAQTQSNLQQYIKTKPSTNFLLTSHQDISVDNIPLNGVFSLKKKALHLEK